MSQDLAERYMEAADQLAKLDMIADAAREKAAQARQEYRQLAADLKALVKEPGSEPALFKTKSCFLLVQRAHNGPVIKEMELHGGGDA